MKRGGLGRGLDVLLPQSGELLETVVRDISIDEIDPNASQPRRDFDKEALEQLADSSIAQADSIAQLTTGVDQISAVVQTNSATSEESAAASEELSSQAVVMKQMIQKFRLRGEQAAEEPQPAAASVGAAPAYSGGGDSANENIFSKY